MRTWLVTVRDSDGKFIDQREIKATGQANAESDAYDWIIAKGGVPSKSTVKEIT